MEFCLLGPLEVAGETGSIRLAGPRQRELLAVLLLHANEVVARDLLIEALWGGRLPENPRHSLDVQISRLRGALGGALATRGTGYVLVVDVERIDAAVFERLLEEGRRANAAGEHAAAASALDTALALWRGRAFADVSVPDAVRADVERLETLRVEAIEERADARLALGDHDVLVAELEPLVAKHPYRERLRGALMLALYRDGRQAQALDVYADGRRRLSDDLGLEPSPTLRELERAILRHDQALLAEPPPRLRRRRLAGGAAAMLAAAAVAGAVVLLSGGGLSSSHAQVAAEPDKVAFLVAGSGKVFGQAPARATVLAHFGTGALWSVSIDGEVTRVDPESGHVTAAVDTGVTHPGGLAVGYGSVWVTDCCTPTLVRIDSATNAIADRIRLPTAQGYLASQTGDVATGAGSVWVSQGFVNPSYVLRLDPTTGRVVDRI